MCNKEQQEILSHNSKKSEKLRNHLMNQVASNAEDAVAKGYERALQHKNKLLEYDRTRCDMSFENCSFRRLYHRHDYKAVVVGDLRIHMRLSKMTYLNLVDS